MATEKKQYNYIRKTFSFDGHQYQICGKTEKEVSVKMAKMIHDLESGMPVKQHKKDRNQSALVDGSITVKEYSETWLETFIRPKVRKEGADKQRGTMTEKNYRMYVQQLDTHILPAIGNVKLKNVRDSQCQRIINSEVDLGMSYSTCTKTAIVLNAMFKQAMKSRIINFNPAEGLNVSAEKSNGRRSLTDYETQILTEVAKSSQHGDWILFLLNTGLRPSESAPLQVKDIDFGKCIVRVYKAIESGSENVVGSPKTKAGNRIVPLNSVIIPVLHRCVEGKSADDFVFTQRDGSSMMTETAMSKKWRTFKRQMDLAMGAEHTENGHIYDESDVDDYGVPLYPDEDGKPKNGHKIADDLCLYSLRHTYGTNLQRAGVSLNEAKTLMGHSDVSVTANIYTHCDESDILRIGSKINQYMAALPVVDFESENNSFTSVS